MDVRNSSLEKHIFNEFLEAAAEGLKIQRSDVWFWEPGKKNPRSTIVSGIPSNNLICER